MDVMPLAPPSETSGQLPVNPSANSSAHAHVPEKIQRSLFGEILDWMLAPLLLLWPISIAVTYIVAKSIANQPFDRALEDRVLILAQQIKMQEGHVSTILDEPARAILRADDLDNIYFQIKNTQGTLIDGDKDLPLPSDEERPNIGAIAFRNERLRGNDVRVAFGLVGISRNSSAGQSKQEKKSAETEQVLIQVAETLEKRSLLANEIIKGVILPQFIILPVALALVWLALSRGLSPLAELQQRIRARSPDDLSPIESHKCLKKFHP